MARISKPCNPQSALLVLAVAAAIAGAGCSDESDDDSPSGSGGAAAGQAPGTSGTDAVNNPVTGAGTSGGATAGTSSMPSAGTTGASGSSGASGSAGMTSSGAGGADPAGSGGSAGTGDAGSGGNSGGTDALPPLPDDKALPIIFVHGYAGSASQYASQKMRFVANGYPADRIIAFEHDGAGLDTAGYANALDPIVDRALAQFGASKVYLVGHSRGTFVSSMYVGMPARAAKVAKYVAIDGSACPTQVPCIAPNQAMFSGQKHVEVCSSKESFAKQYEFLLGEAPKVVDVVLQAAPIVISGRAVNFPANTGRAGATVKVFELDSATGARSKADPEAMFTLGAEGNWGPVTVRPDKHYELELSSDGFATHYYPQRFLRSTDFVRLTSGPSDSPSRMNTNKSDKHSALIAVRMREWLASDVLEVSTKAAAGDQPVVNAMTSAGGAANSIAYYMHDAAASPGNSSLSALPYFSTQPFQYGVDVFIPAADPPAGVITVRNLPRGDMAKPQVLHVPNWPSANNLVMLLFDDFPSE
jgi:pimeloyl-ACP methyl ester carboxylesterase